MGISIKLRDNRDRATEYCVRLKNRIESFDLNKYGVQGVNALRSATPVDSGKTADGWSYKIDKLDQNRVKISFFNSNINDGVNIAILIQYGHATRSGSWVEGTDYINPALKTVFDQMSKEIWEEVTRR